MLRFKKYKKAGSFSKERFPGNKQAPAGIFYALQKGLIRLMVIMAVCLAVYQLKAATNPVDFYLQVAGSIEEPAMSFSRDLSRLQETQPQAESAEPLSAVDMLFSVTPYAPVKVLQEDKLLGVIDFQTTIPVKPGTLVLDARGISYPVSVRLDVEDKNYSIELNNEVKKISIKTEK